MTHEADLGVRDVGVGKVVGIALGLRMSDQDDSLGQHSMVLWRGSPAPSGQHTQDLVQSRKATVDALKKHVFQGLM